MFSGLSHLVCGILLWPPEQNNIVHNTLSSLVHPRPNLIINYVVTLSYNCSAFRIIDTNPLCIISSSSWNLRYWV